MDDFEKYLEEVLKYSKKKEDTVISHFTSHHYWKGSGRVTELILESYRKFNKERADKVKTLVEAAKRIHDECSIYGPEDNKTILMMGPMIEPSEQAVLNLRNALAAMEDD